jgi:carbon storage regulator CsrA
MLILARKPKERIRVPAVDLTISVVSITGQVVRIGIEAPDDIIVLREEVESDEPIPLLTQSLEANRAEKHELRNALQGARVGVDLLEKQIEMGHSPEELKKTVERIKWSFAQKDQSPIDPKPPDIVTALLVEDQANERQLLSGLLQISGCSVIEAETGEQALNYLGQAKIKPDVVLLDMGLPNMDGKEVIHAIRKNPKTGRMPIYVISGRDRDTSVPVDGWFLKPLNSAALLTSLKSLGKVG